MISSFARVTEIVNVYFAGHFENPAKVAGVGLGNVFINLVA